MNCVYAVYVALVTGVAVGIGISWLLGAARGNWNDSETACELIEDCLRRYPGSGRVFVAAKTGLTVEVVCQELDRMHEAGEVFVTVPADGRIAPVYHVVGQSP